MKIENKARRRTFLLLLEHSTSLAQLKNINEDWIKSILNHYLQCPSYLDKKLIPFYIEGFDNVLNKIMNRELFGGLKDIYSELIEYKTDKLTYPLLYIPLLQNKSNIRIIKFNKQNPIRLRKGFDKILMGFNAQYIYLIDDEKDYYIFDYGVKDIKQELMCYTLKYDFINKFVQANGLAGLKSFVVFDELVGGTNGLVIEQDELGDRFIKKRFILKDDKDER